MRTRKVYVQGVKRIMCPELTHCLECQRRLQRWVTISQRTVITLSHVIKLVRCGYRCPAPDCPGRKQLYLSADADASALPGFTFGLDIVILVGQQRLREHKTWMRSIAFSPSGWLLWDKRFHGEKSSLFLKPTPPCCVQEQKFLMMEHGKSKYASIKDYYSPSMEFSQIEGTKPSI